ncbi:Uncharacterized acetyltransferase At3g50280, partial [Linum perenne]
KDFTEEDSVLPTQELKDRVFHFSRHKLGALKAQANAEAIDGGGKISTLQTLSSHIWRAVTRNRKNPDPDRETRFYLFAGLRSRLQPKLPENYLGNAIAGCVVVLKEKVLLTKEKGLGDVAAEINEVVMEQTDDEKLKEVLESWIENPQMPSMGGTVKGGMIRLSSSPRYNVYGNDFGWGKPVAMRSGVGNKAFRPAPDFRPAAGVGLENGGDGGSEGGAAAATKAARRRWWRRWWWEEGDVVW